MPRDDARHRCRFATRIALAVAVTAALVAGCGGGEQGGNTPVEPDPAFGKQPNFVFIMTDDQNLAQLSRRTMPNTVRFLGDHGTTFTNYYASTPLCCPSRASMLTGQYGHNNGVLSNIPGYAVLDQPENLLPDWLQRVGYQTVLIGKWMNGYEKTVEKHEEVPPGWTKWHGLVGAHGYNRFKASNNGTKDKYTRNGPYLTKWIEKTAVETIRKLADETPFYLQVNEFAPHVENPRNESGGRCGGEAVPAPRDAGRFEGLGLPNTPSVNEADVSDKPSFVAGKGPLTDLQLRELALRYECRLEALRSLDRSVYDIFRALGAAGVLRDTVVIFVSDNGTYHGEHRLPGGKGLPYEEAAHMPLLMRVPQAYRGGAPAVAKVDEPTINIDLVPTIVELAGAPTCIEGEDGEEVCRVMDGRSLVPLLAGKQQAWPRERPILHELDLNVDALKDTERGISCKFAGVRLRDWLYVEHTVVPEPGLGACVERTVTELYDRGADPYELRNLAGDAGAQDARSRAISERLARITARLSDCAGIEGRDPEPESGHYCS